MAVWFLARRGEGEDDEGRQGRIWDVSSPHWKLQPKSQTYKKRPHVAAACGRKEAEVWVINWGLGFPPRCCPGTSLLAGPRGSASSPTPAFHLPPHVPRVSGCSPSATSWPQLSFLSSPHLLPHLLTPRSVSSRLLTILPIHPRHGQDSSNPRAHPVTPNTAAGFYPTNLNT